MTVLRSYDLNGKKLSFANWISNLSPQETPFSSMIKKETVQQTLFQWQTDALAKAGPNCQEEGGGAVGGNLRTTNTLDNLTQILRKTVKVSDTADATANYGRGKELQYQMEKMGKELKRDIEWMCLNNDAATEETTLAGRKTAGFHALVAPLYAIDNDTGAIVHKTIDTNKLSEKHIFDMTYNLYLSGSRANIIMYHPSQAVFFSGLQEKAATAGSGSRVRIFENTPKLEVYVSSITDPLGQEYRLIPNRWMPMDKIFFFHPDDWTQMILRAPERSKLAKDGSYEKWMIETEMGLRHRHPFASGILATVQAPIDHGGDGASTAADLWDAADKPTLILDTTKVVTSARVQAVQEIAVGKTLGFEKVKLKAAKINSVTKNGSVRVTRNGVALSTVAVSDLTAGSAETVIASVDKGDAGLYAIQVNYTDPNGDAASATTYGVTVNVTEGTTVQPASLEDAPKTRKPRAKKSI